MSRFYKVFELAFNIIIYIIININNLSYFLSNTC